MTQSVKNNNQINDKLVEQLSTEGGLNLLKRVLAEKSLLDFVRQAWEIVEPGTEFSENWHLDYLEEELIVLVIDDVGEALGYTPEQIENLKQEKWDNRLSINVPPRSMKSLFFNVFFPCWVWIHNPSKKFITVSYSSELSMELNQKRREIIQSDWYNSNWPQIQIKEQQNTKGYFQNTLQGGMYATSVGGTLTGKGADIIFLDDIQNPKQAESEADRKRAIDFITNTLPSRLNNFRTGSIVNIQQRLHFNDVSGFIKETYPHYRHIIMPVQVWDKYEYVGPITNKVYSYGAKVDAETGERVFQSLWEDRMPQFWIEQVQHEQGTRTFNAQYMQDPAPEGGSILQKDWFKHWHKNPITDPEFDTKKFKLIQSWDCAFKGKADSDYVAGLVFLTNGVRTYILDFFEQQLGFLGTLNQIDSWRQKWYAILQANNKNIPIEILIEDKANGPAVIETLELSIPGIIPITPKEDKITRMVAIAPFVEAGNTYLPSEDTVSMRRKYPWSEKLLDQLCRFPALTHDDIPDAFSQGLRRIYVEPVVGCKELKIF